MCSIAHFSIRLCAEASQSLGSQRRNRIRDFYARSSALKRFGMEVNMNIQTFFQLNYGVYITTTLDGERPVGCVTNSIMQITAEPATFAVSVNHNNYTHDCIEGTGRFAFSVLGENTDPALIGAFGFHSSRDTDKFRGVPVQMAGGLPVIASACGYVVCRLIGKLETPTHTFFLGEAEEAEILNGSETPMTYSYYHRVIKGRAPKNAPTYQPPQQEAGTEAASQKAQADAGAPAGTETGENAAQPAGGKWICQICGYVYEGDALPEDFKCPVCGRGPEFFKKSE